MQPARGSELTEKAEPREVKATGNATPHSSLPTPLPLAGASPGSAAPNPADCCFPSPSNAVQWVVVRGIREPQPTQGP